MPFFFAGVDVGDTDHDAGFFDITEFVVDGGAEGSHGGGEVHVGVDEGRDGLIVATDLVDEDLVVLFEVVPGKDIPDVFFAGLCDYRFFGGHEFFVVGEVGFQEPEDDITGSAVVVGVHGHFPEEVLYILVVDNHGTKSVPEVIEGVHAFFQVHGGLVFGLDKGSSQLDGDGEVVADEVV